MTHAPRRLAALLVLAAVLTPGLAVGLAGVQNNELGLSSAANVVVAGIEGEEIPLPTRSQFSVTRAHG